MPGPPRLVVLDRAGLQITQAAARRPRRGAHHLARRARPPRSPPTARGSTGGSAAPRSRSTPSTLTPAWTLRDTLGPPVAYGTGLVAPVRDGLADLDPAAAPLCARSPCRAPTRAPVRLAAAGEILLEQRGTEVVALRRIAAPPGKTVGRRPGRNSHMCPRGGGGGLNQPAQLSTATTADDHAQRGQRPARAGGAVGVHLDDHRDRRRDGVHGSMPAPGPGEPSCAATTHATTSATTSTTMPAANTPDRPRRTPQRAAPGAGSAVFARFELRGPAAPTARSPVPRRAPRRSGAARRRIRSAARAAAGKRASASAPASRSSAAAASAARRPLRRGDVPGRARPGRAATPPPARSAGGAAPPRRSGAARCAQRRARRWRAPATLRVALGRRAARSCSRRRPARRPAGRCGRPCPRRRSRRPPPTPTAPARPRRPPPRPRRTRPASPVARSR